MPDVYKQLTFEYIVLTVLAVLILAVSLGSVFAFVRAIWGFVFSQGDAEKIKKSWSSIRFMVLGISLTISLLFVFPLVFRWMKVPNAQEYSAKNIFSRAGEIIRGITNMGEWVTEFQTDNQSNIRDADPTQPYDEYSL